MTDTDEQSFLKAIAAAPEDDTPRLAFADFLDERDGDGDRQTAAFVRAAVELARTDEGDPNYPALLARSRRAGVLTRETRRPWLDSVPGAKVAFHRGLIGAVWVDPTAHLKHDHADWLRVPVEHLGWRSDEFRAEAKWNAKLGTKLATRPELERLRSLDITGPAKFLTPLLAGSEKLAAVRALHIGYSGTARDEEQHRITLAGRLKLPALDSLRVAGGWPADLWAAFIRAVGDKLTRLHLDAESADDWHEHHTDWDANTSHLQLTYGVAWLDLSSLHSFGITDQVWSIGDPRTAERVAQSDGSYDSNSHWPALRRLHVETNESYRIGEIAYRPEAAALEWFSSTNLYGDGLTRFVKSKQLRSLRRLSVSSSDPEILEGEYCRRLLRLDWGNIYTEIYPPALLAADLPELRWLTLHGCHGVDVFAALPNATNMPNLCTLVVAKDLDDPNTVEAGLTRLANAHAMPHLSLVGLGWPQPKQWWVLGDGRATPVHPSVEPVWRDWWEVDPTDGWF